MSFRSPALLALLVSLLCFIFSFLPATAKQHDANTESSLASPIFALNKLYGL